MEHGKKRQGVHTKTRNMAKRITKKKNIIKRFKQMSMTFLVYLSERIMLS